jgi:MoaA/NifB/PqqE/SkfB family radical SAM enzyme
VHYGQAFRELRVFEVALGGGEPTLHPAFPLIVQQFHRRGVRVNITTKNTRWVLQNDDLLDKLGAVGFSVDTAEQVRAFGEKKLSKPGRMPVERLRDKVMVQHVVGVDEDEAAFADLLDACAEYGIRLTLLGYKTTGRGMSFRPTEVPRWAQLVVEKMKQHERKFWVGIDTVLVKQGKQALLDAGISEWCMTEHEGAFSCYVDAVKGRIGPSSFCGEKEYRPLSEAMGAQEVMDAFAGF